MFYNCMHDLVERVLFKFFYKNITKLGPKYIIAKFHID